MKYFQKIRNKILNLIRRLEIISLAPDFQSDFRHSMTWVTKSGRLKEIHFRQIYLPVFISILISIILFIMEISLIYIKKVNSSFQNRFLSKIFEKIKIFKN